MEPFWTAVNQPVLRQGDLLPNCWVPEFPADFADAKEHRVSSQPIKPTFEEAQASHAQS
jgi:hypothetical protein